MDEGAQSVGDVMQARLIEVRKMAGEYADAQEWLRQWEAKLRAAVIDAAAAQVPKSMIAEAARVSRPTLYAWLDRGV